MSDLAAAIPVILAALGGAAIVVALRECIATMPALGEQLEGAARTLALAGRENRSPSEDERRRLGFVVGAGLGLLAVLLAGPGPLAGVAAAGPTVAGSWIARRRRRYRLLVEADVAAIASGIADAISAGGSLRTALLAAGIAHAGPTAVELARVRADLELGLPARVALSAFAGRIRSVRVDALVTAVLSQERAGGDLAELLRRHAVAAEARRRAEKEARSATAQARLTGGMVVAMPLVMALLVELVAPGFVASMLASPAAALLLALAGALQVVGFLAIRKLGGPGG